MLGLACPALNDPEEDVAIRFLMSGDSSQGILQRHQSEITGLCLPTMPVKATISGSVLKLHVCVFAVCLLLTSLLEPIQTAVQ